MDYFDSKSFNSMQEEAIKRVQEMQRRSKNLVGEQNEQIHSQHHDNSSKSGGNSQKNQKTIAGFNIGNIKIDEEKALIALMIYILYKNGADIKLLLGLGYLLI